MFQKLARASAYVSVGLAILQALIAFVVIVIAFNIHGGGHPPAGAMLLMYVVAGIELAAPVGVILGLLGFFWKVRRLAWWGTLANAGLIVVAEMIARFTLGGHTHFLFP